MILIDEKNLIFKHETPIGHDFISCKMGVFILKLYS